jgi:hypothetical protein
MVVPVHLVIARYHEPLEWLQHTIDYLAGKGYQVTPFVYNKGDDTITSIPCYTLENVGRESHTYLYHVTSTYDKVSNDTICVFLQGGFHDHIQTWFKGYNEPCTLIEALIIDTIKHEASISWANQHTYVGGNTAHWNFRISHHNNEKVEPANMCFGEWFVSHVKEPFPKHSLLHWWIAGIFAVKWSVMKTKTKEYYANLQAQFTCKNPEIGHFCERSWVYIMGVQGLLPPLRFPKNKNNILL